MNLYIYSYNNYYNRIVKKAGDSIDDYAEFLHYGPVTGVYGFTPGDGVDTVQILGSNISSYDGKGDYLIAHNPETGEIDSRWFIIDCNRTRNGQWQLTLHRDLITDYYEPIINSPVFIEKATIPSSSPFIYNKEQVSLNQIKMPYSQKSPELLLKDVSECPWIVGYYSRNLANGDITTMEGTLPSLSITPHITVSSLRNWDYWQYCTNNEEYSPALALPSQLKLDINIDSASISPRKHYNYALTISEESVTGVTTLITNENNREFSTLSFDYGQFENYEVVNLFNNQYNRSELISRYASEANFLGLGERNALDRLNGDIIFDESTGKYYSISIRQGSSREYSQSVNSAGGGDANTFCGYLTRALKSIRDYEILEGEPNQNTYIMKGTADVYTLTLYEYYTGSVTYNVTNQRRHLEDAPYDMFAIPYSDTLIFDYEDQTVISNKELALRVAMNIVENSKPIDITINDPEYSATNDDRYVVYDIQLLPYCPILNRFIDDEPIMYMAAQDVYEYTVIEEGDKAVGFIFHPSKSKFTTTIELDEPINIVNKKIESQCDMYRFVSPNFNGQYDFNAAMNNGLYSVNVSCTYYPFNPFIQVNPDYDPNGLYGQSYGDVRGLTLSGDFSLPIITNAWTQFQLQNKNFENSFAKELKLLKAQQGWALTESIVGGTLGTVSGAASGAMIGSMVPGIGTVVGAAVGAGASLIGGALDAVKTGVLGSKAINTKEDLFRNQINNIQASPVTLSKISAFAENNRIFPFIEKYTCTEDEKKMLANKIAYNGMSLYEIGTINDYVNNTWEYNGIESQNYIKGQLIRLDLEIETDIEEHGLRKVHGEDFHVVNSIANELIQGVYIK